MQFPILEEVKTRLPMPDRLLLYTLVYSLRPDHCLEIGAADGGSSRITCAALDALGKGTLVSVDPSPEVPLDQRAAIAHRATLIETAMPEALIECRERSGGPFEFVFFDGDRSYENVRRDIEGVVPHLSDDAHLLFSGARFAEGEEAIDESLTRHPFQDCGMLSKPERQSDGDDHDGNDASGGMRLVHYKVQSLFEQFDRVMEILQSCESS